MLNKISQSLSIRRKKVRSKLQKVTDLHISLVLLSSLSSHLSLISFISVLIFICLLSLSRNLHSSLTSLSPLVNPLFLLSMTVTMITRSVGPRCTHSYDSPCVAKCMGLGPLVDWRVDRSIQLSRYTFVQRVPLELKWACTFIGDGVMFTCGKMCCWSTALPCCGMWYVVWCGVAWCVCVCCVCVVCGLSVRFASTCTHPNHGATTFTGMRRKSSGLCSVA